MVVVVQREVLREREVEDETATMPILGDVADSRVEALLAALARHVLPADDNRPVRGVPEAGDRVHELALAVAVDPREPDDLASAHLEADPTHRLEAAFVEDVQILDREQRLRRLPRALLDPEQHLAADHQAREALLGRALLRDGLDRLAAPKHGDAVGDLEHLVELVRDEDDRLPLGLEGFDDLEELLRLLRREDRGRLVEDEDLRAPEERLQDLRTLLLADRDLLDPGARVDGQPESLRQLADLPLGLADVEHRAAARLVREHDVLRDRHHRDEHEVLVHHADPEVDRVARRADLDLVAAQKDLALVGRVEPVEDVHERRLAGSVLAQEGVHLAGRQLEVDLVVRDDSREPLGDAAELEEWLLVGHWGR